MPKNYKNFALINDAFVNCYLDNEKVDASFLNLINPERLNFTRYNFFYINFLLSKNRENEALKILEKNNDLFKTNLLLDQTRLWFKEGNTKAITKVFDCRKPSHLISEFFYLILRTHSLGKRSQRKLRAFSKYSLSRHSSVNFTL